MRQPGRGGVGICDDRRSVCQSSVRRSVRPTMGGRARRHPADLPSLPPTPSPPPLPPSPGVPGRRPADHLLRGPHLRRPQGRPRRRPPHPPLRPVAAPPFSLSPFPRRPGLMGSSSPSSLSLSLIHSRPCLPLPSTLALLSSGARVRRGGGGQAVAGGGEGGHRRGAAAQVHLLGPRRGIHGGASLSLSLCFFYGSSGVATRAMARILTRTPAAARR